MKKLTGNMFLIATLAIVGGQVYAASEDTAAALKEIDSFAAKGSRFEACKAIGDTANEFDYLSTGSPEAHEALLGQLDTRFNNNNCIEVARVLIPKATPNETTSARSETIRWWESLSTPDRLHLGKAASSEVNNRAVARMIFATIQAGDREGAGRRAERMEGLRQRDNANREVAREHRERDRGMIASPVSAPEGNATDLDY